LDIAQDGAVAATRVPVDFMVVNELVQKARIYYTGVQRSATAVLKSQDAAAREASSPDHHRVIDCLSQIKEIGKMIKVAFDREDLDTFAKLMDEHWMHKRRMSASISLSKLDHLYEHVKAEYGVLGGKIIGAGGGGFIMLYCPVKGRALDEYMAGLGMPRIDYFPSLQGAKVVSDLTPIDDFGA
jgi:D-glycero-alpha-D-manno-heptose-7-phosphate kinase